MDPDMIRPRRSKPCPPTPRPHGENVVEACQHDSYNFREDPLPPPISPSLWACHQPPRPPSHVRNYYWNDNLDRFSRMQRGDQSPYMGYRMNFRDPLNDFHEDHTLRHCIRQCEWGTTADNHPLCWGTTVNHQHPIFLQRVIMVTNIAMRIQIVAQLCDVFSLAICTFSILIFGYIKKRFSFQGFFRHKDEERQDLFESIYILNN
ncbi:uncharacterized protein [Solanum tuberosum]|uniref:uncharacterized protein n=1 Tax=Solanum tuberosum TaxID=4113 RepID=UPI00073A3386|nr:PREDICTED: uncharacterized protein LOC102603408 [Solanum tuberosum]